MQAARQEMEPNTTSFWIFLLLPESSWLQKDGLHMFEPRHPMERLNRRGYFAGAQRGLDGAKAGKPGRALNALASS